jgi:glycosyltransferase involved in cell wall biosynthesis
VRVTWVGSFEPDFSRNRKLARLMNLAKVEVTQIQSSVWGSDRVALASGGKLSAGLRYAAWLPRMLWRLMRSPRPDLYLVSYPGWFDVPFVWIVSKLKARPLVFDPFISLYDTVVADRSLFSPMSLIGRVTHAIDAIALRLASLVIADTGPHLRYYDSIVTGVEAKGHVLPLGADDEVFQPSEDAVVEQQTVLFHGTFVPLQGLTTVVEAAHMLEAEGIRFVVIGDGQDRHVVKRRIEDLGVGNVRLTGLLPIGELPDAIARATICLGIFGDSDKAARVVPNKVYEALAMGRPVVTRSSPAVAEALSADEIITINSADCEQLAGAIRNLLSNVDQREAIARAGHRRYMEFFHEDALALNLGSLFVRVLSAQSQGLP